MPVFNGQTAVFFKFLYAVLSAFTPGNARRRRAFPGLFFFLS